MKNLARVVSINLLLLFTLFSTPLYAQYCNVDTVYLSGEQGGSGYGFSRVLKCKNLTYSADGSLEAYDAIIFEPNFHVKPGVNFTARVTDCRGTKPYLNIPVKNAVMDNACLGNSELRTWSFEWNSVEGATSYQLNVKNQNVSSSEIDIETPNNIFSAFYNAPISNNLLDNWEAKVRAKVDGEWTPWYGGQGDQPLPFSVEPVSTDCAPTITAPLPQATLDNGCTELNDLITWDFEWTEVVGATAYELIVRHPAVNFNSVEEIVTTNSFTYSEYNKVSSLFTGWTVKVRAQVDGLWTDYHGSTLAEEVMLFNVEHINTDCAPLVKVPVSSPKATLENGCLYPESNYFEWIFSIEKQPISEMEEVRILRPNGTIYTAPNLHIISSHDEGSNIINYIFRTHDDFIPDNELTNWSVQARSKINNVWTAWFGHAVDASRTYFDIAQPHTDCAPLITSHLPDTMVDNGCLNGETPDDWYFEWQEVAGATQYAFTMKFSIGTIVIEDLILVEDNFYTHSSSNYYPNSSIDNNRSVRVAALVNGVWTDDYGVDDQPLPYSIEPLNTDCPQWITSPTAGAVMDNGCRGYLEIILWPFEFSADIGATENQIVIKRPNGSVFSDVTIDGSLPTYTYFTNGSGIPVFIDDGELTNWSVQMRSKVDGIWLPWRGDSPTSSILYFDVEPADTDCPSLITDEAKNRNSIQSHLLDQSIDLKVYPNPFQQKTTIEYSLSKPSNVHLDVYTLTGKLVTILINQTHQSIGNHSTTFKASPDLPIGMYLVRLQVGETIQYKKIVLN